MNADPNKVADLQACNGCGGHQDDPPSRLSERDSGSDRKDQHNCESRNQHNNFEPLSKNRPNQKADH